MVVETEKIAIPRTLAEFMIWNQAEDGFNGAARAV